MDEFEIFTDVFYIHKIDHRNNSKEKSQWTISQIEEQECFKCSLISNWSEPAYTSWGLHFEDNKVVYLGRSAENEPNLSLLFIAKFVDSTQNNKWHGYPANPGGQKQQDIPPQSVLKDWGEKKYFRPAVIRKLSKGQKCRL